MTEPVSFAVHSLPEPNMADVTTDPRRKKSGRTYQYCRIRVSHGDELQCGCRAVSVSYPPACAGWSPPGMAARLTLDIFLPEQAKILARLPQAGGYVLLRLSAPQCAAHAQPGTLVRLTNSSALTHTAALLRTDGRAGWIEILSATSALPDFGMGEHITLNIVPGAVFTLPSRPYPLIIGDAIGTAPTVFMANKIRQQKAFRPLVLLGYEGIPPFIAAPSRILVQGQPHRPCTRTARLL